MSFVILRTDTFKYIFIKNISKLKRKNNFTILHWKKIFQLLRVCQSVGVVEVSWMEIQTHLQIRLENRLWWKIFDLCLKDWSRVDGSG